VDDDEVHLVLSDERQHSLQIWAIGGPRGLAAVDKLLDDLGAK